MKIRTSEELVDKIYDEISWRSKELMWIKSMIHVESSNLEYALRSGVPIAYAHFEGAIKVISEYYLIYISDLLRRKKIKYKEIQENFLVIGLQGKIAESKNYKKLSRHMEFIQSIGEFNESIADFHVNGIIDTESNLKSEVFMDICLTIGINIEKYETKFNFIDSVMLKLRNEIAHGNRIKDMSLDQEVFVNICDTVLWLINEFSNDILDFVTDEKYMIN